MVTLSWLTFGSDYLEISKQRRIEALIAIQKGAMKKL